MNVGWDEQFLAPLWLIPLIPRIPRIAGDEFQTARKACNLQYKTDFGDSGNHQNQTFPHACPKVVPEGPEVVKGGALGGLWGSLAHPCGPFCVPKDSPWGPFGSPWVHLGSHGIPLGLPRGHRGIQLYKQTPDQPPKRPDVNM